MSETTTCKAGFLGIGQSDLFRLAFIPSMNPCFIEKH